LLEAVVIYATLLPSTANTMPLYVDHGFVLLHRRAGVQTATSAI